eukprot:gene17669-9320_t
MNSTRKGRYGTVIGRRRPWPKCNKKYTAQQNFFMIMLMLCDDVDMNPGPRKLRYPFQVCEKAVKWGQRAIACENCSGWFHPDCLKMGSKVYEAQAYVLVLNSIPNIEIIEEGVLKLLTNPDAHKSAGPDEIPSFIPKDYVSQLAPIINQASTKQSIIPNDWRKANVTPIFKKGER